MPARTLLLGVVALAFAAVMFPGGSARSEPEAVTRELNGDQLQALATTLPDFAALLKRGPSAGLPSRHLKDYSAMVRQTGDRIRISLWSRLGPPKGGGVSYYLRRPFLKVDKRLDDE